MHDKRRSHPSLQFSQKQAVERPEGGRQATQRIPASECPAGARMVFGWAHRWNGRVQEPLRSIYILERSGHMPGFARGTLAAGLDEIRRGKTVMRERALATMTSLVSRGIVSAWGSLPNVALYRPAPADRFGSHSMQQTAPW